MFRHFFRQDRFACQAQVGSARDLPATRLESAFDRRKVIREYSAGQVIYGQGAECEGIFYIESGLVGHRMYDAEGHSALIRLCGPGEFIGYRSFLFGGAHRLTAEALLRAHVAFVGRSEVHRLLVDDPSLHEQILRKAVHDLYDTEERYFRCLTRPAKVRAIYTLLLLYERFGRDTPSGEHVFELPLSRQDLAALIGIAPESMSRTIKRLEAERLVAFDGRRVRLHDLERLVNEVELLQ